jgi:YVTN family beta-propeller protein
LALAAVAALASAEWYAAPAGVRPAMRNAGASILPGGAIVAPAGDQYPTGPNSFGLALSPSGRVMATASAGQDDSTPIVMERSGSGRWEFSQPVPRGLDQMADFDAWERRGAWRGLVFSGEHAVFAAEGGLGRISQIDWSAGRVRTIDLNQGGAARSYAGDLALDAASGLLYAADEANARVAVIETRSRQVIAWAALAGSPAALALSKDGRKLYAAIGGDAGAVTVVDVSDPSEPKVEASIATGSAVAGVTVGAGKIFVANGASDSIGVIDGPSNRVEAEIPIRIPGLEQLRGVAPAGMAYDERTGLLFVAESGINAVGVIDVRERRVLGHVPAGWFPTRVAIDRDTVLVANAKGQGADAPFGGDEWRQGSVSAFPIPNQEELPARTAFVMEANGFAPRAGSPQALPSGVRYVALIVKEGRTYDEMLGDVPSASNGPAMGMPALARFGMRGYVDGQKQRLSIKDVGLTPNHHAIADRWSFSDNFYADSPAWADALEHLAGQGAAVEAFGVKQRIDTSIRDQDRATEFQREIEDRYIKTGADLPRLLFIHLPNDSMAAARPGDGYPYQESFVADNDLALGRIVEFLSHTKWWEQMAVFVTEDGAWGGVDHIDARRTVLLCAGPWCKRNYVSHTNAGFPGLLKTIFRLLHAPPLSLQDAAAADLADCFAAKADMTPYRALPVDKRIFEPAVTSGAAPL